MKLSDIIFISQFPSLDLHGYDRDYARMKVNEFINDNIIMQNEFVVIIHGVGSGILKRVTLDTLSKNKNVVEYQIFKGNIGCTIVKIKKIEKNRKKW